MEPRSGGESRRKDILLSFIFGVVFVVVMLVVAIYFPEPKQFQEFVFRVVLSLAAAGLGAVIPGIISVNVKGIVRATGAFALFAIIFWFNPPKLVGGTVESKIVSLGIPEGAQLSGIVSQIERNVNVTVVFKDCSSERLSAVVNPGTVSGDGVEELLENLLLRVKEPGFAYDVQVIQKEVRYDIVCR